MTEPLIAGRYRKLGNIGTGGMARVFLAQDERLGRRVAIKQLHADSPGETARRFEREARVGASLNHPNLVSVYDVATEGESVLIVMEYVEGETLRDQIASGPLSRDGFLSIMRDVAGALDHAHDHGVIHRDVKPANILIRDDCVAKLADLGIATAAEHTNITRSGVVLGTASYMAPEQLEGFKAGPAADVFALASVAYEALSGRKARDGATPMEIAHRVVHEQPPDLREAWPEAPPAAAKAIERGMAMDPAERTQRAGHLARELERALEKKEEPAPPPAADLESTVPMQRTKRTPPPPAAARPKPARAAAAVPLKAKPEPKPAPAPPSATPARRRRSLPVWVPVAAVLLLCGGGAIALASLGGGDDAQSGDRAGNTGQQRESPRQRQPQREEGSSGAAAGGTAAAPTTPPAEEEPEQETAAPAGTEGLSPSELDSRGRQLTEQGRYDEAIPLLEQAVAAYPEGSTDLTYAFALYNLGRALRLSGRPQEAIPVLEKRLAIPNQTATVQEELDAARAAAGQ